MALNPRPDPGMLRELSSSMDGLEEATDRLQEASEWAVEGHFLVTSRALLRYISLPQIKILKNPTTLHTTWLVVGAE